MGNWSTRKLESRFQEIEHRTFSTEATYSTKPYSFFPESNAMLQQALHCEADEIACSDRNHSDD